MKLVISESLRDNFTALIPVENRSCMELMRGFLSDTARTESEFARQCRAARFIFDDVTTFSVEPLDESDDKLSMVRDLIGVHTTSSEGVPLSQPAWLEQAQLQIDNPELAAQIDVLLQACLPALKTTDDAVILSADAFITSHQINRHRPLGKEAMLYLLATSGIAIALPPVVYRNKEDIDEIREKFEEERIDYLLYLHKGLDEMLAASQGKMPDAKDIYEYSKNKFALDLKLKSQKISAVAKKHKGNVLRCMFTEFLDQAPSIGASVLKMDFVGGGEALFKVLLASAKGDGPAQKVIAEYKEAAYLYRISSGMPATNPV